MQLGPASASRQPSLFIVSKSGISSRAVFLTVDPILMSSIYKVLRKLRWAQRANQRFTGRISHGLALTRSPASRICFARSSDWLVRGISHTGGNRIRLGSRDLGGRRNTSSLLMWSAFFQRVRYIPGESCVHRLWLALEGGTRAGRVAVKYDGIHPQRADSIRL